MMKLSKKMMNAQMIEKNSALFKCPICTGHMKMIEQSRLVCEANHSFDLSKQGYVNLAPQAHVTKYDQSLFEARNRVIASGFFKPLLERLTMLVSSHLQAEKEAVILDAGCGEGSHLSTLCSSLAKDVTGIGVDLAKEGILAAAKDYPGNIWAVGDLANCPFQDTSFDLVLNILSPANYSEFTRLLKPGGLFLKVIPEARYLQELRDVFYENQEQVSENNTVDRMTDLFDAVRTETLTYTFPLTEELLATLIQMTPLTWGASQEKVEEALQSNISSMTIDFKIIIGMKR